MTIFDEQETGFINIDRHNKTEKLTEDEKKEIIRKLQWHTSEEWKHFVLTYFVSNKGRAYSVVKNEIITLSQDKDKVYYYFFISWQGMKKKMYIHRIVNLLFNHDTHFDVIGLFAGAYDTFDTHHLDLDKLNNTPDNLVWMDHRLHGQMHRELQLHKLNKSDIDTIDKIKAYEEKKIKEKQREKDIQTMYDCVD